MAELTGVIAAAATPLRADLTIDGERLVRHCRWLLDNGCDGINLLGTTGEATSFSVEQRREAMETITRSGLPLDRFMVGTGAAALADAVRLTRTAMDLGFAGALVLPPFYYKGITDDGLIAYIAELIGRVGSGLKLYLYHFPQNSGVPYPVEVVRRLKQQFPTVLLGLKDSSGDLAYSAELARTIPGLAVFPSAEGSLADARAKGFAGCISATANITAPFASVAWRSPGTAAATEGVADAVAIRTALSSVNLIAAVKWAIADLTGDREWLRVSPPLQALTPAEADLLRDKLAATAYAAFFARRDAALAG
jgi:4-hydroxy-tetrahydrodipicolinate synthase